MNNRSVVRKLVFFAKNDKIEVFKVEDLIEEREWRVYRELVFQVFKAVKF